MGVYFADTGIFELGNGNSVVQCIVLPCPRASGARRTSPVLCGSSAPRVIKNHAFLDDRTRCLSKPYVFVWVSHTTGCWGDLEHMVLQDSSYIGIHSELKGNVCGTKPTMLLARRRG